MTLPKLLIIGAMKSGTTSLYRDLLTHPRIYFPIDKEPENLCHDDVLTPAGRRAYERLFEDARPDQVCAEASTAYTKRPTHEGVAERAKRVLGDDVTLVYVVRDPIKRMISQHYHDYSRRIFPVDIGEAIEQFPEIIDYSRYAMQLEPWIEAFGPGSVHVIRFEDFVADRPAHVARIQEMLGLDPRPELVEPDKVHNRSEGKPMAHGAWHRVINSTPYRRLVRPLLPVGVKDRLRRALLPKAPPRPDPPTQALIERLRDDLAGDMRRLTELAGPDIRWDQ